MTFMSGKPLSSFSSASGGSSRDHDPNRRQSDDSPTEADVEQGQVPNIQPPRPVQKVNHRSQSAASANMHEGGLLSRNPFLFRTKLDFPVPLNGNIFKSTKGDKETESPPPLPSSSIHLDDIAPDQQQHKPADSWADPTGISTRVWSEEETKPYPKGQGHKRDNRSVSSTEGVVVETMFTRETENVEAGAAHQQQPQR